MDKQKAQQMRVFLEVALTGFEEHFGVAVKIGSIRYTDTNASMRLEVSEVSENGEVQSREVEDFKRFADAYGLSPEWLGEKFTVRGKTFTITGLNTRAKKYKIRAKDEAGNPYKFNELTVQRAMS